MAKIPPVRIVMDPMAIKRLARAAIISADQATEAIKTDVIDAGVIPMDNLGDLSSSGFVDRSGSAAGKFRYVFTMPYARRLYWNPQYNFRTDYNPNARGEWLEEWISGTKKDFGRRIFIKRFRVNSGGLVR